MVFNKAGGSRKKEADLRSRYPLFPNINSSKNIYNICSRPANMAKRGVGWE
jgi:hypothetical protein